MNGGDRGGTAIRRLVLANGNAITRDPARPAAQAVPVERTVVGGRTVYRS